MTERLQHPRLPHALMHLRPGARPLKDFVVASEIGGVPYLVDGSMQSPPTQAEVDAVTADQLDAAQLEKNLDRIGDSAQERLAFEHENRLRALEGQPPLDLRQFKLRLLNART